MTSGMVRTGRRRRALTGSAFIALAVGLAGTDVLLDGSRGVSALTACAAVSALAGLLSLTRLPPVRPPRGRGADPAASAGNPGSGGRSVAQVRAVAPTQDHEAPEVSYFCYISRNKVDQMYAQIDPSVDDEVTELRSTEHSLGARADVNWGIPHVVQLFQTGGTYGRKGFVQREVKVKETYLTKLRHVLLSVAGEEDIPGVAELLRETGRRAGCYHHAGKFRVTEPVTERTVDGVITIASEVAGRPLLLDCSLRNFSEGPLPDGSFNVSSANRRFFDQDLELSMTTVFLLLEATPERLVGTPLFLKLSLPPTDPMTAL
ncbi:hypothetical protein ABZZ79_07265 [Streptomyces sp. NPDC006458]|uniref:hypothetical protein n=1 Tax=Streptomyces sp. NPDC006458 TaxID=3154302 RepID=UPI0033BEDFA8